MYEEQVEQYLGSIALPEGYQDVILEAYRREDEQSEGFDSQRNDLENKLKRLKQLYAGGDLSPEEYQSQRDHLRKELAALPAATASKKETIERLATYLQNVGQAWREANQEQRNRLAKTLFDNIRIEDRTIKGVTPQMEFTPLLVLSDHKNKNLHPGCQGGGRKCGSDGIRTRGLSLDRAAC